MRLIRAYAHRGGAEEITENSYEAIEHAVRLGYSHFETDVHLSDDGVVYLQHDDSLYNPWGLDINAQSLSWEKISRIRSPKGHRPVTLEQALIDFPQLYFNIEPKTDESVEPAITLVKKLGAMDRVLWTSFSAKRMRKIRELGATRTAFAPGEVLRLWLVAKLCLPVSWARLDRRAVAAQVPVIYNRLTIVSERFIAAAHRANRYVDVWTINDADEMRRLLKMNVDGIMSDRPTVLKQVCEEFGLPISGPAKA